jgi:hypothetical protein
VEENGSHEYNRFDDIDEQAFRFIFFSLVDDPPAEYLKVVHKKMEKEDTFF